MAAYNAGAKTVLIPYDNQRDLEELDPLARENLKLVPCKRMSDVLHHALLPIQEEKEPEEKAKQEATKAAFLPFTRPAQQVHLSTTEKN